MYEARQNKEKVSRRIDTDGGAKQSIKMKNNTMMGSEYISKITNQNNMQRIIQRYLVPSVFWKGSREVYAKYENQARNFQGGEAPDPKGFVNVTGYVAKSQIGNEFNIVAVDADTHVYHHGHMLAESLGGGGGEDNIFAQDGGQNTGGSWASFEARTRNMRDRNPNSHMTYEIWLEGSNIQQTYF